MYKKNYVPRSKGELSYTSKFGIRDMLPKIGSLLIYTGTFVLWLYLHSAYYNFGSKIITPLTGAMWILGAVLALLLPSQRQEIINGSLPSHTRSDILFFKAKRFRNSLALVLKIKQYVRSATFVITPNLIKRGVMA